jgi:hypothetical protein
MRLFDSKDTPYRNVYVDILTIGATFWEALDRKSTNFLFNFICYRNYSEYSSIDKTPNERVLGDWKFLQMQLKSFHTLNRVRNSCCRVISVANIRELICCSSSGRMLPSCSATLLSRRQPTADLQWWFSRTEVFWNKSE